MKTMHLAGRLSAMVSRNFVALIDPATATETVFGDYTDAAWLKGQFDTLVSVVESVSITVGGAEVNTVKRTTADRVTYGNGRGYIINGTECYYRPVGTSKWQFFSTLLMTDHDVLNRQRAKELMNHFLLRDQIASMVNELTVYGRNNFSTMKLVELRELSVSTGLYKQFAKAVREDGTYGLNELTLYRKTTRKSKKSAVKEEMESRPNVDGMTLTQAVVDSGSLDVAEYIDEAPGRQVDMNNFVREFGEDRDTDGRITIDRLW